MLKGEAEIEIPFLYHEWHDLVTDHHSWMQEQFLFFLYCMIQVDIHIY